MNFEEAAAKAKLLPATLESEIKLQLYGLYKQATVGDVEGSQPWAVQIEARAKYDAWESHKGKSSDDAKAQYVELVTKLATQYGV